ncbi:hypothetical protein QEG98_07755 [Myxococcus sp. MxC21-1]|uniref:hypothetical protein n=1 Tax=Myxococcus sp. MxC21-1 TaxID=3041439 RepID=UPI002931991F|nr:hypothetical protein [Myxococcus sp. MxC21-1]WNZ63603.1 hypothetical protein QEG98_07755 [Myxococcus sp. MxC21-1]
MAVAALLHLPAATWVGMAALFVALVDRGGPYRDRALAMGAMTLLGSVVGRPRRCTCPRGPPSSPRCSG